MMTGWSKQTLTETATRFFGEAALQEAQFHDLSHEAQCDLVLEPMQEEAWRVHRADFEVSRESTPRWADWYRDVQVCGSWRV